MDGLLSSMPASNKMTGLDGPSSGFMAPMGESSFMTPGKDDGCERGHGHVSHFASHLHGKRDSNIAE